MKKKLFIFFLLIFTLLPSTAFGAAHSYHACFEFNDSGECIDVGTVCYEGIVPCGRCLQVYNDGLTKGEAVVDGECNPAFFGQVGTNDYFIGCQLCHFLVMGIGVVEFLLIPPDGLFWILALVFIALAGAMIVLSQILGSPQLYQQGINIIKNTILGLVLSLLAWIIVNTIFLFVGVSEDFNLTGGGWASINCPIELPENPECDF